MLGTANLHILTENGTGKNESFSYARVCESVKLRKIQGLFIPPSQEKYFIKTDEACINHPSMFFSVFLQLWAHFLREGIQKKWERALPAVSDGWGYRLPVMLASDLNHQEVQFMSLLSKFVCHCGDIVRSWGKKKIKAMSIWSLSVNFAWTGRNNAGGWQAGYTFH